jgi:hypothetical protein
MNDTTTMPAADAWTALPDVPWPASGTSFRELGARAEALLDEIEIRALGDASPAELTKLAGTLADFSAVLCSAASSELAVQGIFNMGYEAGREAAAVPALT